MDEFLKIVQDVASEYYQIFGELGREGTDDIWYLGRDRGSQKLVALRLRRSGVGEDGKPDYDLEVAQQLDGSVSVGYGDCRSCGKPLRRWVRFCTQCGADLAAGGQHPSSPGSRAALLAQVKLAAEGVYEVLGEMPWGGGGGLVFFAIELATQRLVRLRLKTDDAGGGELAETTTAVPLPHRLSASYLARTPPPEAPRPSVTPQPRPPAPRPEPIRPQTIEIGGRQVDAMTLVKILGIAVIVLVVLQLIQLFR